jgi:hypothetical protein
MKKTNAALVLACLAIQAWAGQPEVAACNMIVNPNFERTFEARRLTEFTEPGSPGINPQYRQLPGYAGKPFLPYGWSLLPNREGAGVVSLVENGGRRALRVQTKRGEQVILRQNYFEVVPEAAYTCGLSIRGKGTVSVQPSAENPAVWQTLDSVVGQAKETWTKIGTPVKVGYHRHLGSLRIDVGEDADVLLRDVEFIAPAAASTTPERLVTDKPRKDDDTLFFEDFEGDNTPFTDGGLAKLTGPNGGRFGRGLHVTPTAGGAKAKLTFGKLPPQGTIEFWFKPDALPQTQYDTKTPLTLWTQIPDRSCTGATFELGAWQTLISFGFRQEQWHGVWAFTQGVSGWGWWQSGTWHHFAGSWDGQVIRSYVDGTLTGVCYGKDRGQPIEMPNGEAFQIELAAAGVIDEIRVSKVCRFGPVVPRGFKNPSFLAGEPPAQYALAANVEAVNRPRMETSEKDLDAIRAKASSPPPAEKADFIFGADKAKPAWEGMGGMSIEKDYFGKGADGVWFNTQAEVTQLGCDKPSAFYWKMEGLPDALAVNAGARSSGLGEAGGQLRVKAGKYYLGLWIETQNEGLRTEYSMTRLMTMLHLNGYPVRFSTTSDPVQVKPGIWLAELQSAEAVELKNGDELAVRPSNPPSATWRLVLHRNEPKRGHGVTGQTFGIMGTEFFARLRLAVQADITGSGDAGDPLAARISLANPLPYAADAAVDWKLADYFGAPVAGKVERVRLEPHAVTAITHKFTALGDAQAYQLDVRTRPADGFKPPVARPREIIDLNDWTKLEFLPNLLDPLDTWSHARKTLATNNAGSRRILSLNGSDWERGPLVGRRAPQALPAGIKYDQKIAVPMGRSRFDNGVFGYWQRKKFRVPAWMKGETFLIDLRQIEGIPMFIGEATVYLNGRRMEKLTEAREEMYTSMTDVTSALKLDAENELVILLRGGIAQVREDYVDKYDFANPREIDAKQDYPGAPYNEGNLGTVRLMAMPAARVRQTLVVPDAQEGTLLVLSRVENRRTTPCTVELRYQAFQDGKAVEGVVIPPQTVTLKPGECAEVRATGPGKGLVPYTPAQPALARLATTLVENGATVDVEDVRFGYRSVKVKGGQLSLNGKPITLLGIGYERAGEYFERENGTQTSRGLYIGSTYGDEIGRFTYPLITLSSLESWDKLNNDKYWERERANAVEVIWNQASHPCQVGWDLFNETYFYSCYAVGLDGQAKGADRYYSLVQEVNKKVWPHFWFLSDGNASLGNRLDFTSWHYCNQAWSYNYVSPEHGYCDRQSGTSNYPPDRFFLDGAANEPLPTTIVHGTSPSADDWKPGMACSANEEFWFVGDHNGPAVAKYIGDRAAISPAWQFLSGRGMWWGRLSVQGYRDLGASVCGVYPINFLNTVMQAVTFTVPAQEVRYYSGAHFEQRLNIHDDEFAPGSLEFTWKLTTADGKEILPSQTEKMESSTSFLKRDKIAFTVPQVQTRTEFVLDMALGKNGHLREHEQRIVEVWPASSAPAKASSETPDGVATSVALFDPEGKTQAVLERFGCKVKPIQAITPEALAGVGVLVVGPDCVKGPMPAEQQAMQRFVSAGGRVLLLPQQQVGLVPADVSFEKRNYASMGFVVASGHPVMQGLKDRDFAMWNPGHLVAKGLYRAPSRGNFLPLVECYHMDPVLVWSPLWELYLGKGSILVVQLPLLADVDTEPMAAQMWRRLLGYMTKDVYRRAETKLALWDGVSGGVLTRLKELRADFETVKTLAGNPAVAMVELNWKAGIGNREPGTGDSPEMKTSNPENRIPNPDSFRKYVQDGGTLVLHRARPEHKEWLEALTGQKISVEIQPYRSWVDRQMLEKRDGLAEGLTNIDFYWRSNVGGEGPDSVGQVSCSPADGKGQVEYVVKVDGAQEYLFPGGWVELKLGSGRIVIDQLKWELPEKDMNYYGSPMRVASILLTNLGITQKPPAPRPTLPDNVKYQTIDLAKVVNRGLVDDKPNDGIGWLDWGPDQDLRDFPTGDVNLGVPFHVTKGDKNAVVLRVDKGRVGALADYPESATIPVNLKNVGGLWFLHTGGWTPGATTYAWREIRYADGSKVTLGLNGANFADWNYGRDSFPDEEETTTTVAWKGACKMYPITRVYKTLWVNPCPDKEITDVVLTTKGLPAEECRFVAHLALTAAILPAKPAPPVNSGARDPKKSQALLQEALKLTQARKDAQASAMLADAVQADDRNVGAWVALTELRARTDSVEAFTALCHRWFAAMPDSYQAHNTLGQFLEKKGKYADALAEYRQSLKLEWNQPPTIEAKKRMDKLLNQK